MTPRRPNLSHFAAGILLLVVAGPALAQPNPPPAFPPFPAVKSLPAVATWARRNTDLPLNEIVGVGADSVFAVERAGQPGAASVRAVIRQEAITPEFAKRLGGRSATMVVDIDCAGHQVFQREVNLYVGSNRQGASRQLGAAKDWQPIPPGTYMDRVMAAACDPAWRPLYAAVPVAAPPPTSAPLPAPAQPTVSVAVAAPPPAPPVQYAQSVPAAPLTAPARAAPQTASPRAAPPPAPSGSGRVELGLFGSVDEAMAAWRAAESRAPGKRLRIELSVAGKQTLYRALIDGYASRLEADTACASMTSVGIDCVVPR